MRSIIHSFNKEIRLRLSRRVKSTIHKPLGSGRIQPCHKGFINRTFPQARASHSHHITSHPDRINQLSDCSGFEFDFWSISRYSSPSRLSSSSSDCRGDIELFISHKRYGIYLLFTSTAINKPPSHILSSPSSHFPISSTTGFELRFSYKDPFS